MSEDAPVAPGDLPDVKPPEKQNNLTGHEAVIEQIRASFRAGRVPGAVLLHGPQGIGKATLAYAMASEILTETGDQPAGIVAAQVAAGAHPNLSVLRRAPRDSGKGHYTVIRVDEVRALIEKLHQTRGRVGWRLAIVDTMDEANPSATNALLKVLEEPPAQTTFFLISHRPGQLLPTIRSRTRSMAMRALSDAQVADVLRTARPELPESEIVNAVALSNGRPRRAFEALGLKQESGVTALREFLANAAGAKATRAMELLDALPTDAQSVEAGFARDLLLTYVAAEARGSASSEPLDRGRLASANALWEKAQTLLADADIYNVDFRQTLGVILDLIRNHARQHIQLPAEAR